MLHYQAAEAGGQLFINIPLRDPGPSEPTSRIRAAISPASPTSSTPKSGLHCGPHDCHVLMSPGTANPVGTARKDVKMGLITMAGNKLPDAVRDVSANNELDLQINSQ